MMTTIQSWPRKNHWEGELVVETFCVVVAKSCQSPYHCLDDMDGYAERTDSGLRKTPLLYRLSCKARTGAGAGYWRSYFTA